MLTSKQKHYIIFTSRHVTANPGVGTWCSTVHDANSLDTKSLKRYNKFHLDTTPHFLDLEAVVSTTEAIHPKIRLTFIHDSSYLDNIVTKWIFQWESKNFLTAGGKPMANSEIIKKLSKLRNERNINFIYTGNKEKPIYTIIANEFSKLYLHSEISKLAPGQLQLFKNSQKPPAKT